MRGQDPTARARKNTVMIGTARHRRVPGWVVATVAAAAFAAIALIGVLITSNPGWSAQEIRIVIAVNGTSTAALDAIAHTIAVLLGPTGAAVITLGAMALAALLARSWVLGLRLGILIGFSWGTADLVKALVQRPRPDPALLPFPPAVEPTTFSYPSGHTAFAVALGVSVFALLTLARARYITLAAAIILVAATAWSRVYLGVHYPTDTLASMFLVPFLVWALVRWTGRISLFTRKGADRAHAASSGRWQRQP